MTYAQTPYYQRIELANKVLKLHPHCCPVIIEPMDRHHPPALKSKLIVSRDQTMRDIITQIRTLIGGVYSHQGIIYYIGTNLVPLSQNMGWVYDRYKSNDNLLYIRYAVENVFG